MNKKIKLIREKLNLSPKDISSLLNISSYKYSTYEKAGAEIPCEIILLLAKIYGILPDWLFYDYTTENEILMFFDKYMTETMTKEEIISHLSSNILSKAEARISYRYINKTKQKIYDNVIEFINYVRDNNNFSKLELANALGCDTSYIDSVMLKKQFVSVQILKTLVEKYKLNLSVLIDF